MMTVFANKADKIRYRHNTQVKLLYLIYSCCLQGDKVSHVFLFRMVFIMMIKLEVSILLAAIVALISTEFTTLPCFHLRFVTLDNNGSSMAYPNTYSYNFSWPEGVSAVSKAALTLGGYKVTGSGSYLSYEADISSTGQGATISFSPKLNLSGMATSIIQFQVLAISECAVGKIEIWDHDLYPSGSSSSQSFTVRPSTSFSLSSSTSYNFYFEVYFRDFVMTSQSRQQMYIYSVTMGTGSISFYISTQYGTMSAITRTRVTLLIIQKSFYPSMAYDSSSYDAFCSSCTKTKILQTSYFTPSSIDASLCVVSLLYLQAYANSYYTKQTIATLNHNIISISTIQLYWALFSFHCYLGCADGYYMYVSGAYRRCQQCPASCLTCSDSSTCTSCDGGKDLSNGTCSDCPSGSYLNQSTNICTSCKVGCRECQYSADSCSACQTGYYLTGTTCSSCLSRCSSCQNENHCTSCQPGYYLTGTQCVACLIGCGQCDRANNCIWCIDGYQMQGAACYQTAVQLADSAGESGSSSSGVIVAIGGITAFLVTIVILVTCFCKSERGKKCRESCVSENEVQPRRKNPVNNDSVLYQSNNKIMSVEEMLLTEECSICLGGSLDCRSSCGHFFHTECLRVWKQRTPNCPLCRSTDLDPVQLHCRTCRKFIRMQALDHVAHSLIRGGFECRDCLMIGMVGAIEEQEA